MFALTCLAECKSNRFLVARSLACPFKQYNGSVQNRFLRGHINAEAALDPDFGEQQFFTDSHILKVVVESPGGDGFWFFLVCPLPENAKDLEEWSRDACEKNLNPGEFYRVVEVNDDDLRYFEKSIPILSYHPRCHDDSGQEEWVWLVPPKWARN